MEAEEAMARQLLLPGLLAALENDYSATKRTLIPFPPGNGAEALVAPVAWP